MPQKEFIQPRTLKGFRDFLPHEEALRGHIIAAVREQALLRGFQTIATPMLEYAEILLGNAGGETEKEVYLFKDQGGREVGLRFDLTVPFARFVAEHQNQMVFPFKKLQIGEVFRGEKPQKGRYRQFYQADFDIIGADSLASDVEIILTISKIIHRLIKRPFTVILSHRQILTTVIRKLLPNISSETEPQVFIALDKLAKIGKEKVINILTTLPQITPDRAEKLIAILMTKDQNDQADKSLIKSMISGDEVAEKELERFYRSIDYLNELSAELDMKYKVDFSVARGLGYYTGIVLETIIDGFESFGSIASGGRYDQLVSRYSQQQYPGVGCSIGVDRLLTVMEELQITLSYQPKKVFVAIATDDARLYGFKVAEHLRQCGIICDVDTKEQKLAAQFKHADRNNYDFVLTVGSDELQSQTCSLKILATGEQKANLRIDEVVKYCS